ncbi:MAG TPA: hypothetical protein VKX16_08285 [Chloroflexota bacterium]|nr:hypothetical protein [Chloroflexota bacterium]
MGPTIRADASSNPEAPDRRVRIAPQGDMSDDIYTAIKPTWTLACA